MLTPEQTALRLRDARINSLRIDNDILTNKLHAIEIERLQTENEHLTNKLKAVKGAIAEIIKTIASASRYSDKVKLLKLVEELELDES